ncbi:hypothetical protein ACFL4F_03115 [Candidatus Margulisiibacteriota bacterium]
MAKEEVKIMSAIAPIPSITAKASTQETKTLSLVSGPVYFYTGKPSLEISGNATIKQVKVIDLHNGKVYLLKNRSTQDLPKDLYIKDRILHIRAEVTLSGTAGSKATVTIKHH